MRSLQARVAAGALLAVAVTLALVLAVVVSTFATSQRKALDRDVRRSSTIVSRVVAGKPAPRARRRVPPPNLGAQVPGRPLSGQGRRPPAPNAGAPATQPPVSRRVRDVTPRGGELVRVTNAAGTVIATAGPQAVVFPDPPVNGRITTVHAGGHTYRAIARAVSVAPVRGAHYPGRVIVAADTAATEQRISTLRDRVIVVGLIGLLLAGVAVLLLTRLALRSLERLRERAAVVTEPDETEARLPRGGPSEVDDLAGSLNAMLDRLAESAAAREETLQASRRFAADAGHELRTPLAAMSANVDTLRAHPDSPERGAILDDLRDEQRRMAALLDALQALARGDAGDAVPRQPVDVADVADAAVQSARRRHPSIDITLDAPDDDQATVSGWPEGIRLAVDNLVENAARHGGRRVAVDVRIDARPGWVVTVTVDDDGPGIPVADRERVLERFERGAQAAAGGSGLGLALVAQQAALHGGSVEIGDAPGGGARVTLTLAV
jgi:signal transduction histidine kinase